MKILSIDLGEVRTGIAVSDFNQILASPFCVIKEKEKSKLIEKIFKICKDEKIGKVIVGLPKNMDGSEGESAKKAKKFAEDFNRTTKLPVIMIDERKTTALANNFLNEVNVFGAKRKNVVDSVAATIILQDYLDSNKSKMRRNF